jgi:hypothetical protein
MKNYVTVCVSMFVGIAIGAAAVQTLHAQTKPPICTIAEIDVKNVDAYMKEYAPVVGPRIKKAGGRLIAASLQHSKATRRISVLQ